jgi:hypothetical protein
MAEFSRDYAPSAQSHPTVSAESAGTDRKIGDLSWARGSAGGAGFVARR